jgi:peptide deformylase
VPGRVPDVAVLPILTHPDPVLRAICAPVTAFDDSLRGLVQDMFDTMYAAPGRGLAGPQVGRELRLFVMDVTWKTDTPAPQVFVNPELTFPTDDRSVGAEGCLSIPGDICHVPRATEVDVRWQDLEGLPRAGRFTGFEAICIQHEADHLDGILCIDRAVAPPDVGA